MEISEIKKRIMERIESEKASSKEKKPIDLAALSVKMGKTEDDLRKIFNAPSYSAPSEPAVTDALKENEAAKDAPVLEKKPRPSGKSAKKTRPAVSENIIFEREDNFFSTIRPEAAPASVQNDGLREKIAILEGEKEEFKKSADNLRASNESLTAKLAEKDRAAGEAEDRHRDDLARLTAECEDARSRITSLELENEKLQKSHSDASGRHDNLFTQLNERDKEVLELKNKLKSYTDERDKKTALEADIKKLKKLHEDALRQNDALLVRIEEKDKEIGDIDKKLQEERSRAKKIKDNEKALEDMSAEKNKAVANMESLRSKLYASTKEIKELSARLGQVEDLLKHRDRKISEYEKAAKNFENEKNAIEGKLRSSEEARKAAEDKISAAAADMDAKEKRLSEAERMCAKNIDTARKEMELQVQAVERNRKALEGKIAQLTVELEAKNARIRETEQAVQEFDGLVKDAAMKLQATEDAKADMEERIHQMESAIQESVRLRQNDRAASEAEASRLNADIEALKAAIAEKERLESELSENILRLESELEARDKKIQADIKYCEDVVREVNDLRQKIKAYRLKAR